MNKIKIEKKQDSGKKMYSLMERLYPLTRSITGNGTRQTLNIIKEYIPIIINEVPTGTPVFDWIIPKEWNITDAYVKNSKGERVIDFKKNNLHVLSYSQPVNTKMTLEELKPHLYTLPEQPDVIPYMTTYYKEGWGFCLSHQSFSGLKEDMYEVVIESTLSQGSLTYAELYIKGETKDEIIFSSYICHPSMCNDNLSGPVLLTALVEGMIGKKHRYSYRFLLVPETIGALAWLSRNDNNLASVKGGLVITCVGDSGDMTYKRSKQGDAYIDKVVEKVLRDTGSPHKVIDFFPMGSDERQFCSPGFNLPMGSLVRTLYGCFPEYHTSADDLDFVKAEYLEDSLMRYREVVEVLEWNETYINQSSKGEPRLDKRGLYRAIGIKTNTKMEEAILWTLSFSDGQYSLLDIANRSSMSFALIKEASMQLVEHGLLKTKTD